MTAAVLVGMVAGAELLGWWLRGRTRLAAVAAWLLIALVAAGVSGAIGPWGAVAVAGAAGAWLLVRWRWGADLAMGLLVVVAAIMLLADGGPNRAAAIIAAMSVAVLLAHSANEVCRDVIARARTAPATLPDPAAPAASGAAPASAGDDAIAGPAAAPQLRGGRFIGPLERWLIVALALVGAEGVIVGLMAAKGIGRFPEISGDRGRGSTAEEFLVGSLVSWALAGAGALMIAVLRG